MTVKLKEYFPLIREREELLAEIKKNKALQEMFTGWEKEQQEAWLTLLTCDEPERIKALIEKYPEFRQIYEEGYEICRNTERVMGMFSMELYELDRNTVQYMIDEQQETIDAQKETLKTQEEAIKTQEEEISRQKETIDNMYKGTINILRSLNMSDQEIVGKLCAQYQIKETEAQKYL